MIVIETEQDERLSVALRGLLDAAVRSIGINAAEAALLIDREIVAANQAWELKKVQTNINAGWPG